MANEHHQRLEFLPILCLCILLLIVPASANGAAVERSLSASTIEQFNTLDVTLSIGGIRAGGIVETIPDGCTFSGADCSADRYQVSGNTVMFSVIDNAEIVYHVRPVTSGTWTFSGVWTDAVNMTDGTIPDSDVFIYASSDGGGPASSATTTVAANTTNATPVSTETGGETYLVQFEGQTIYEIVVSGTALPEYLNVSCASVDLPGDLPAAPGVVYHYYNLSVQTANVSVDGATIRFSVSKEWMESNDLSAGGIALCRYSNGWSTLPTTLIGSGNGTYTFEAKSPEFSTFAIAGTKQSASVSAGATTPVTIATPKTQGASVAGASVQDDGAAGLPLLPLIGGLAVLAIVICAGVWYVYRRRDTTEEE